MKYPIEIELTDFCGLKCKSCINPLLNNKGFISLENYYCVLNYLYSNKENFLYINFSGIGDMFLHKDINILLELFIKKFKNTGINLLIPTKGQSIRDDHIILFKKIINNGINLNISIGLYSLIKRKYNLLSGSDSFNKTIDFIKKLKNNNINFSIELLDDNLSFLEKKYFKKILEKIKVGGEIHKYHNFGGFINNKNYNYGSEECSFNGNKYKIEGFYCSFIPFISKNGNIYSCSISGKNKKFLVGNIKELFKKYPNYIDLVFFIKNFLNIKKCINCSIYKAGIKK